MTTWRSRSLVRLKALLAVGGLPVALVGACGGEIEQGPGVEGNTNWFRHCEVDLDCGPELQCLCQACTAACTADTECAQMGAPASRCLTESDDAQQCAPAVTGVCVASSSSPETSPEGPTPAPPGFVPDARCGLEFPPLTCDGLITVYTYQNGQCVAAGGCTGRLEPSNAFDTRAECLADCEGRPAVNSCPPGTEPREICLQCGLVGNCERVEEVCASLCANDNECADFRPGICFEGVCQAGFCE